MIILKLEDNSFYMPANRPVSELLADGQPIGYYKDQPSDPRFNGQRFVPELPVGSKIMTLRIHSEVFQWMLQ